MKDFSKRIITGVLVGGILLTGSIALAASGTSADSSTSKPADHQDIGRGHGGGMGGGRYDPAKMAETWAQLVTDNILSQSQSDQIQALAEGTAAERQSKMAASKDLTDIEKAALRDQNPAAQQDLFSQAVTAEIITQTEADDLRTAIQEINQSQRQAEMTEKLLKLVDEDTITQAQADAVLENIATEAENRQSEMAKIKDMTDNERQLYMNQLRSEKQSFLQSLIDDGTITDAQAEALHKTLPR